MITRSIATITLLACLAGPTEAQPARPGDVSSIDGIIKAYYQVVSGPAGVRGGGHTTAVGAGGGVYRAGGAAGVGYGGAAAVGGYRYAPGYGGVGYSSGYRYSTGYGYYR